MDDYYNYYEDFSLFRRAKAVIESLKRGNVCYKRKDGSVEEESCQDHEFYYDIEEKAIVVTFCGEIYEKLYLKDYNKTWTIGTKKEDLQ